MQIREINADADDALVPEADQTAFRKSMDSIDADYTFISYPGAKHAYTNPEATALGQQFNMPIAYNALQIWLHETT